MEKNLRKNVYMYTYMLLNHFAVYLKLTHYKSIALQFFKKTNTGIYIYMYN